MRVPHQDSSMGFSNLRLCDSMGNSSAGGLWGLQVGRLKADEGCQLSWRVFNVVLGYLGCSVLVCG